MLSDGRYEGATLTGGYISQMYHYDPISWTECEVWDGEAVVKVTLTHEYQPDLRLRAVADATPEVRAAAREWQAARLVPTIHAEDMQAWREAVEDAHRITKGTRVEVTRGRKYKHGTTGIVFWIGTNQWGESAGVHPDDDPEAVMWLATKNLSVVDADAPSLDEYTCTDDEALEIARERVANMYPDPAPAPPRHTVQGGKDASLHGRYGMTHDMDCPGCVGTSFTASPRSETYWSS